MRIDIDRWNRSGIFGSRSRWWWHDDWLSIRFRSRYRILSFKLQMMTDLYRRPTPLRNVLAEIIIYRSQGWREHRNNAEISKVSQVTRVEAYPTPDIPDIRTREVRPSQTSDKQPIHTHEIYFLPLLNTIHEVPRSLYPNLDVMSCENYLILGVILPLFPPAGVSWPMIILSPGVVGTA